MYTYICTLMKMDTPISTTGPFSEHWSPTHASVCICTHVYEHEYGCICPTHASVCICTYVYEHEYGCISPTRASLRICMYVRMYTDMNIWIYMSPEAIMHGASVCICTYVRMYADMNIWMYMSPEAIMHGPAWLFICMYVCL